MVYRSPATSQPLVDPQQARQVMGALGLLIALCGTRSCLGMILQQARCEVSSLLQSDAQTQRLNQIPAALPSSPSRPKRDGARMRPARMLGLFCTGKGSCQGSASEGNDANC
jgi:hypothetical protein